MAVPLTATTLLGLSACLHQTDVPPAEDGTPSSSPSPTTADFRVGQTGVALPRRCRPGRVTRRVIHVLRAFNEGRGDDFARAFAGRPVTFQPYNDVPLAPEGSRLSALTREEIARFVEGRHEAGDAWTATAVNPPLGDVGLPVRSVYGLGLRISVEGRIRSPRAAKVVVDCRSGLILAWVGPLVRVAP